ncbi:MAG: phospholipase D-like domain-containing protein [Acidimicrobiales bacterium]
MSSNGCQLPVRVRGICIGLVLLAVVVSTAPAGAAARAVPLRAVSLRTVAARAAASPLRLITEPAAGIGPVDKLLASARHSVELVVYELADAHLEAILAADEARGVSVRVLLDRRYEQSHNEAAYSYLTRHHVTVRWASAPGIYLTHEKAVVVDGRTALVMTFNLVAYYYSTTRDFAVVDTRPRDVGAIEHVFNADWAHTGVLPSSGADLVWSPGAEGALVRLIDGARRSLLIENEEMNDPYITAPLEAAARRGARVEVVMTASSAWDAAFDALSRAGVIVRTYSPRARLYIHAKAIVADAGHADEKVFVGSENFSIASLVYNRELGIITGQPSIVRGLERVVKGDFARGSPWHP